MNNLIYVGLGGAAGSMSRYILTILISKIHILPKFPFAILIINVIGSLFIGFAFGLLQTSDFRWQILSIGFCGGFTTFSSFSLDIYIYLSTGEFFLALLYVMLSLVLCVSATFLGFKITSFL